MFNRIFAVASLALAASGPLYAAPQDDVDALRADFDAKLKSLQADYEARLKALENRVQTNEIKADNAQQQADTSASSPASANAFNPEVSLILQGAYIDRAGGERPITGFMPVDAPGSVARGFSLDATELVLASNIDPYLRGFVNLAMVDDQAEVEEAWFQSLGLGNGLTLKAGRFLSGVGYQNEKHPHAWDFADNNLMYSALFGEHLVQDGLQLRWLAPTELFMELGAEVAKGQFFPGSDNGADKNGAGSWAGFAHLGGDVGASNSWRGGLSYLHAAPRDRESTLSDVNAVDALTRFSGTSATWIADFVWKWAPEGNAQQRNLIFATEYFKRDENGDLQCQDNLLEGGACTGLQDRYDSAQSGGYAQAIYQFMPRWRTGVRYDRLDAGSVNAGVNRALLDMPDFNPTRWSLMTDYSPSEFSRFRLQYNHDKSLQDNTDNALILQYIMSLGPHGAHKF
jgi:hypothetical protein